MLLYSIMEFADRWSQAALEDLLRATPEDIQRVQRELTALSAAVATCSLRCPVVAVVTHVGVA